MAFYGHIVLIMAAKQLVSKIKNLSYVSLFIFLQIVPESNRT